MNDLRSQLEKKYLDNFDGSCSVSTVAEEVMDLFNADKENYFDVTGFAKDFYLAYSLPPEEKELFYETLVVPDKALDDYEDEVTSRLFSFENHISEIYDSKGKDGIDRNEFENIARSYFRTYSKVLDEEAEKGHQDF